MKPIIVDTNILFAAMRSANSRIREVLERPDLSFYAPNFLIVEIFKHKEKILYKSKAREEEVYEFLHQLLSKIQFINEDHLSLGNIIEAYRLCKDVDEKDTIFVALTLELEGELWMRDEALKVGLIKKGFNSFLDFRQKRKVIFERKKVAAGLASQPPRWAVYLYAHTNCPG